MELYFGNPIVKLSYWNLFKYFKEFIIFSMFYCTLFFINITQSSFFSPRDLHNNHPQQKESTKFSFYKKKKKYQSGFDKDKFPAVSREVHLKWCVKQIAIHVMLNSNAKYEEISIELLGGEWLNVPVPLLWFSKQLRKQIFLNRHFSFC